MAKKPIDEHMATATVRRVVVRDIRGLHTIMGLTKEDDPAVEASITRGDGSKATVMRTKMNERAVVYEELNPVEVVEQGL